MIINAAALSALFQGFKTIFNKAFEGAPSDWDKVAMLVPSSTSQEVYAWLGSTSTMREWIGDRVIQQLKSHNFTIRNKTYESTVGVPREAIEDDQTGVYSPMIADLGEQARMHPDQLIFALLAAGFTGLCYDGQYYFDTDHPVHNPTTGTDDSVSNYQAGTGNAWYLLDTTRAIKPLIYQRRAPYKFISKDKETDTNVFMRREYVYGVDGRCNVGYGLWQMAYASKAALTADNYATARAAMMGRKGDNGKPLGVRPNLLVCDPSNEAAAKLILEAEYLSGGGSNTYRNTAKLLVTPWLA